jgi:hypothetical protein
MDEQQPAVEIDDDDTVLMEGGPLDEAAQALVVSNGDLDVLVTQAEAPLLASEEDLDALFGEDEDEEDLADDDLELVADDDEEEMVVDPGVVLDHAFELPEPAAPVSAAEAERVAKLEAAVKQLAGAEVTRESKRVRRKVTAATGGAGAIGFLPILLQLVGAFEMSPEVASTAAAGAAALGALVAGWATPERASPLPPDVAAQILTNK